MGSVFVIGSCVFIAAAIALVLATRQVLAIRKQLALLGGRFGYEVTYSGGYSGVILRLFEGEEHQTHLTQVLGLAKGLVPWQGPGGWYLRPVQLKGFPAGQHVWELIFYHEKPPLLPLGSEMMLAAQLDHMEAVLKATLEDKGSLGRKGLERLVAWVQQVKAQRSELPVKDQTEGGV